MDTIKSFGITDLYERRMSDEQEKYRDAALTRNAFDIKARVFTNLIGTVVALTTFGHCLMHLWSGAITFGTMTLFLQQRSTLTGHFNSLVSIFSNMLSNSVSASRIRELTELPREKHDSDAAGKIQEYAKNGFSIYTQDLDFSYDERKNVVSGGVLHTHSGEIVALIEESGEGKTMLMRLFLGLIFTQRVKIKLYPGTEITGEAGDEDDGWSVNADVRRFISYVPQGNTVLARSVEDNLRMVKEDASDEEIRNALELACA